MNTCRMIIGQAAMALAALALNFWLTQQAYAASFTYTGLLNVAREYHSATLLPNGEVLVAGGWNASYALSSAELYNPSNGTWTPTGSLVTTNRLRHRATLLPNGKVLVAGGWNGFNTLASAELYDPATETWTQTGSLATGRYLHTATLLTNGQVLVTGGLATGLGNPLASAERYDPVTGIWTTTGPMATTRWRHTATLLPNGKVLVAGGADAGGPAALSSAELYDPTFGNWIPTGAMTTNRNNHTATLLGNGLVLVAGGSSITDVSAVTNLSTAELYDPVAGTWRATGAISGPRGAHRATLLPNGQVLVTGGFGTGDGSSLASAELYDPASGAWTNTGSMDIGRDSFTLTLLANGNVLAAGGQHWTNGVPGPYLDTAELYDSAAAPAPNSIAGTTFSGIFTDTSGWAPPGTRWLLLMASSGNTYAVAYNDYGTYSNYSAFGAIGTADLMDHIEGPVAETFMFATPSSGSIHLSNAPPSASYAIGEFEFFSGAAPDSVAGKTYYLQIEYGAAPLASTGSLLLKIGAGSYTMVGDGVNTTNSEGSYSYSITNTATGTLFLNDSLMGSRALFLSFSNSTAGGFTVFQPSPAAVMQVGHFIQLPTLSIAGEGSNIVLSWPTNFVGFRLQNTVQLESGIWNTVTLPQPPLVVNGRYTVTIPSDFDTQQKLFYRLSNQ